MTYIKQNIYSSTIAMRSILFIIAIIITLIVTSCDTDNGVPTYREDITGSYCIKESDETLTFGSNGVWYYDKCRRYPEDDVYGTYTVNEDNKNIIYCFYYIESEDTDFCDTMCVTRSTDLMLSATGVPTHGTDIVSLYRK